MSKLRSLALLAGALLVAVQAAPAQSKLSKVGRRRASVSTAIHEAWLKEVLDLDVRGAAQAYGKIRKNAPRKNPERWIAITRLAELGRLGVIRPEPTTMPSQAPPAIKKALQELAKPVPFQQLLDNPTAEIQLPPLRPATRLVQTWVRDQIGPTVEERLRLRARSRRTSNSASRARWYAIDVLYVELEGRSNQAAALRKLYFANWQPPKVQGSAEENLAALNKRLDQWIESEGRSQSRAVLRDLKRAIGDLAKDDPATAIALVRRLPRYAERLLLPAAATEPAPNNRSSKDRGDSGGKSSGSSSPGGKNLDGKSSADTPATGGNDGRR